MSAEIIILGGNRQLMIDGQPWMADLESEVEIIANWAQQTHGKILCLGLGLDIMSRELRKNPMVTQIDVVEINYEVVALTQSVADRVIRANALSYVPDDHYDFIYLDIWQMDTAVSREEFTAQKIRYLQYGNDVYGALQAYEELGYPTE